MAFAYVMRYQYNSLILSTYEADTYTARGHKRITLPSGMLPDFVIHSCLSPAKPSKRCRVKKTLEACLSKQNQ